MFINSIPFKQMYLTEANRVIIQRENDADTVRDVYSLGIGEHGKIDYTVFNPVVDYAVERCSRIYSTSYNYVETDVWINVVRPKPRQEFFRHSHKESNIQVGRTAPDFTWVYYLQLFNNTVDKEGSLELELDTGNAWYHPLVGNIITFKGDTYHSVIPAPNSTKNRIVIAGNVTFQNRTKQII